MRTPFLSDYQTSDSLMTPRGIEIAIQFWRRLPVEVGYQREFRRRAFEESRAVRFWWGIPEIKSDWVAIDSMPQDWETSEEPEDYAGHLTSESAVDAVQLNDVFRDGYALFEFEGIDNSCLCFCSIREGRGNKVVVELGPKLLIETHRRVEEMLARELEHRNIPSANLIEASDLCRSWFGGWTLSHDSEEGPRFRSRKHLPDILDQVEFKHSGWREDAKVIKNADGSLRRLLASVSTKPPKKAENRGRKSKVPTTDEKQVVNAWKTGRFKRHAECDLALGKRPGTTRSTLERLRKRKASRNRSAE